MVVELSSPEVAIVGILGSVVTLIPVIFYNALQIKQNTKARHYEIFKDVFDRFSKIQENVNNSKQYHADIWNFANYIQELVDFTIIQKELVLRPFKIGLGEALWLGNNNEELRTDKDNKNFFEFCKKNKIVECKPPKWTLNTI